MALCNRSAEHAVTFAANHGLSFLDWRALQRWEEYDWIIFGTKSPDYLLKKEHLADKNIGKKLIIDLCVPRNVDPNIYTHPQIQLLNIDQINHALRIRRESLLDTLNRAEQLVYEASKQTIALFHQREINRLKLWIQPQTVAVVGAGSE
jgi:glutamyl-tRNA reductase